MLSDADRASPSAVVTQKYFDALRSIRTVALSAQKTGSRDTQDWTEDMQAIINFAEAALNAN